MLFECPLYQSRWCALPNGINLWPEYYLKQLCPITRTDDLGITVEELTKRIDNLMQIAEKLRTLDEEARYPDINCLENYSERILMGGKLFSLDGAEFIKGRPHECHWNSAAMFKEDSKTYQICVGYALFDLDWYQHTWLVREKKGRYILVDPTMRFEKYYGYMLTAEESKLFCQQLDAR